MLVQDYSARYLTYDQDASRAFAGATEIMSHTFPGGIFHGLPVFFFDIALLWQPEARLKRRRDCPSWSWTGWKGGVQCWNQWSIHYAGIYRKTGHYSDWVAIAPLRATARYHSVSASGVVHAPPAEFNGFYEYQALRDQKEASLPEGWQRHEHSRGHYYTSADAERGDFRFGFPVPRASFSPEVSAETDQILLCTAPFLVATLGPKPLPSYGHKSLVVSVSNSHGQAQLILPPQFFDQLQEHATCHLVAISEAEVGDADRLNDMFSFSLTGRPACLENDDRAMPFYNILWIQWYGHLAYRKALGIIRKNEWDALKAEVTTIRLG